MIVLHVYMTAKPGKEAALEAGIRDSWIAAMAQQPGFLHAATLKPFSNKQLDALGALKPAHTFEVISFWESEEKRLEWVARPIHNQVFMPLLELADKVAPTLQTVEHSWSL
ncbi:MAG: antibiotic biosynthesis monooxygenase [Chloroflexi bacterium]|nr:antibiotic biosynthesis monooxygenase [Chloroflexota bacterium]